MQSKILNTVIDSLYIRSGAATRPTDWLTAIAQEWRQLKKDHQGSNEPLVTEIPGIGKFRLLMKRGRHYEFILANSQIADIRIVAPEKWGCEWAINTGQLFIAFRSHFMQHEGIPGVYEFLSKLADAMMVPYRIDYYERVSRMDLAVDVQVEKFFDWDDVHNFTSRSRFRDVFTDANDPTDWLLGDGPPPQGVTRGSVPTFDSQNAHIPMDLWNQLKGSYKSRKAAMGPDATLTRICHDRNPRTLYFGKFGSKLYARIYNKTAEIRSSGKSYMEDFWRALGWDGVSPVARVEFSLSGDLLRDALVIRQVVDQSGSELQDDVIDLRPLKRAVAHIPHLWRYLTYDWLRHCERGTDSNMWRWEASEVWQTVQSAWPDAIPATRTKAKTKPNTDQILKQAQGCLLTYMALVHPPGSKEDTADNVMATLLGWQYSDEFSEAFEQRRAELGRDELSDTWFSAENRRQMMLEGIGS